jgi:acetylornithine/succinyldiaminopimelate/putrescine aminotransferase
MAIVDLSSAGSPTHVLSRLAPALAVSDATGALVARLEAASDMVVVAITATAAAAKDQAIARARAHTQRSNVVACRGTAAEVGTRLVSHGDTLQALRAFEQDRPAAFVVEVIQASHNTCVPPPHFFKRIRAGCDDHAVLLLSDETTIGIGRTGSLLAIDREKVAADLIALSLAVAPGVDGGVVLARRTIAGVPKLGPSDAAPYALAVLETIERDQLLRQVKDNGKVLQTGLHGILESRRQWAMDTRGRGLLHSMSLWDDAGRVVAACRERGLAIATTGASGILFAPPIDATAADITETLALVDEVLAKLNR